MIDFQKFVDGYAVKTLGGLDVGDLYRNYEYLDVVFTQFDQSKEGYISQDEWLDGCQWLNSQLPTGAQIADPLQIFRLIDLNCTGSINMNELLESFRIGGAEVPISPARPDTPVAGGARRSLTRVTSSGGARARSATLAEARLSDNQDSSLRRVDSVTRYRNSAPARLPIKGETIEAEKNRNNAPQLREAKSI